MTAIWQGSSHKTTNSELKIDSSGTSPGNEATSTWPVLSTPISLRANLVPERKTIDFNIFSFVPLPY